MKRFYILALAAFLAASCSKPAEESSKFTEPAGISGQWVFSAMDEGSGLVPAAITEIMSFDGDGYIILKAAAGKSVTFDEGNISADESDFTAGTERHEALRDGDRYRFATVPAILTCTRSGSRSMTFDCSWDDGHASSVRSMRMEKVLTYGAGNGPSGDNTIRINGSVIKDGNDLVGVITNGSTNAGIAGVVVSDGYNCTATDENGVYQFSSTEGKTRMVFYTTPSEYAINVESRTSGIPSFYAPVTMTGARYQRNDFILNPLPGGKETSWTFMGVGDPQCANTDDVTRFTSETIADMNKLIPEFGPVYAMTLGDNIFDSNTTYSKVRTAMGGLKSDTGPVPFFATIGNHDHDASDDYDAYSCLNSYYSWFGPVDYSFDRGDVHIVSMDNVRVSSRKTTSKSNKFTWEYKSGFTDEQIEWLRQDLSYVADKEHKMVFICFHIPLWTQRDSNKDKIFELIREFKEAHLMVGHTHYHSNVVQSGDICKGGLAVYEHIHGAACGAWWTENAVTGRKANITVSGGPSGYTVYRIEGASITDRFLKGTNRDRTHQLRVYDGNQTYNGTKKYSYNWYIPENIGGAGNIKAIGNPVFNGCFVAEVFDDDPVFWKVELWQKGVKVGDFKRVGNGASCNIASTAFFFNECAKNSTSYCNSSASHYWYFKPASADPLSEKDWEVRAVFTHPGSGIKHTYTVDKLTTDYSDFEL